MRILLVTEGTYPYVIGGVSTWCDQLIRGLEEHSFSVLSVTSPLPHQPKFEKPDNIEALYVAPIWKARRELMQAGRNERMAFEKSLDKFTDFVDGNLVNFGQGLLELSRMGDHYDLWPLFERRSVWERLSKKLSSHLPYTPRLAELALVANWLRSAMVPLLFTPVKTDMVHTVVNGLAALPAWTASKVHGVPLVLTEHGVYLRERYLAFSDEKDPAALKYFRTALYQSLARLIYLHADRVLSVSQFNRQWQHQFGAPPDRTKVIPNGVDPKAFPDSPKRASASPTIVWVGRIDPLKDVETLIRAFRQISLRVPSARLKLFGPIPEGNEEYANSLKNLVADYKLSDKISFEGPVKPAHKAYESGDVVVLSSVSEGFPYTIIEAMMTGRPVVATRVGGIPEVLADTGMLVEAQKPADLADAVLELLQKPGLRRDLAKRGQRRALTNFTLDNMLSSYRAIYDDLTLPTQLNLEDPVLLLTSQPQEEDANSLLLYEEEGLM